MSSILCSAKERVDCDTLEVVMEDVASGFEVSLFYSVFEKENILQLHILIMRGTILSYDNSLKRERKGDDIMKKKIVRFLGMLLILSMLFALVGCGGKIEGKWEAECDLSKYLNEMMDEELGVKTEFKNLKIKMLLTLNEGSYEFKADNASVKNMYDEFLKQYKVVVKAEVENTLKEYDMTMDALLSAVGVDSFDEYYKVEMDESGVWKFEDNKLWLGDEDDIDEDSYYEVELKGRTMTWTAAKGEDDEMAEYLLPLVFKKK